MCDPQIRRHQANVVWVHNTPNLTGVRWCYLFLPDSDDVLISCMIGNPARRTFKILEEFRPATELELTVLSMLEKMTAQRPEKE